VNFNYNEIINNREKNFFSKTIYFLFIFLRRIILRYGDPLMSFKINRFNMKIPLSHNLPYYMSSYPYYSKNIGRIAQEIKIKYNSLSVIDIGANIGDTIVLIKGMVDCPILCIEGNKKYYQLLSINAQEHKNVFQILSFVGEYNEQINSRICEDKGTASLETVNNVKTQIRTLADILKDAPDFFSSKLIKIDTDGYDVKIIRGAIELFNITKPVLFFEYHPYFMQKHNESSYDVFKKLSIIGYKTVILYDNFGYPMMKANVNAEQLFNELFNYCSYYGEDKYFDICIFHSDDEDLAENIWLSEQKEFKKIYIGK